MQLKLDKKLITKTISSFLLGAIPLFILQACSVYKIQETEPFSAAETWQILPILNHSDTPEAGKRVADIAATLMRSKGIRNRSKDI